MFLYFGIGNLFLWICKFLEKRKILHKIINKKVSREQTIFEIKQSIKSIVIFGFSIIPVVFFVRIDIVQLLPDSFFNIFLGLIILTLWNEIHFYIVHRFMHQPLIMKHIHYIHHKSKISSVYSVYSFHWLEALLLSTVPITIIPFVPFSIVAIFTYPFVSILLNFAGHSNYRFGNGKGENLFFLATHHNEHHSRGRRNFGFALNFLDKLFSKQNT